MVKTVGSSPPLEFMKVDSPETRIALEQEIDKIFADGQATPSEMGELFELTGRIFNDNKPNKYTAATPEQEKLDASDRCEKVVNLASEIFATKAVASHQEGLMGLFAKGVIKQKTDAIQDIHRDLKVNKWGAVIPSGALTGWSILLFVGGTIEVGVVSPLVPIFNGALLLEEEKAVQQRREDANTIIVPEVKPDMTGLVE